MEKNIKKSEIFIYIFFFLISFCKGIGLSSSNLVYYIIYIVGLFFAVFKVFEINFTKRELFLNLIILIIGVLDFVFGKEATILFTAVSFFILKKSNIDNIIISMFYGRLIGFFLMILLPMLHIITMNSVSFYRNGAFILRYSFGYTHPNLLHSSFNIIVIMFIYIYFSKLNLKDYFLIETINYVLYKYTFSRTGFLILTFSLVIFYLIKNRFKFSIYLVKHINLIFLFLIIVSFLTGFLYEKFDLLYKLDILLSGRIRYISLLLHNFSIPLIKHIIYDGILFDNGYIDMFYNGGFFASLWFIILQIKTNKFLIDKQLYKQATITLIFLVYSVTESYYLSSLMNISLLFFAYAIYKNNSLSALNNKYNCK